MANYQSSYTGAEVDAAIGKANTAVQKPYSFTSQDILVGNSNAEVGRLAKGNNLELLGVNSSGNLAYTKELPVITTAPSSANTNGGLILVVLASDSGITKYDGYLYIIKGN